MSSGQTLAGSAAIVTAAGQGLGEAIAKIFAAAGARVAAVDMDGSQAQRVATEIEAAGGAASALTADVSQSAAVENMVRVVAHPAGFALDAISCPRDTGTRIDMHHDHSRRHAKRRGSSRSAHYDG
jgi:NAD(P)-dependent dehydrogenase (short-subunit alcohol dehydrogenase family)